MGRYSPRTTLVALGLHGVILVGEGIGAVVSGRRGPEWAVILAVGAVLHVLIESVTELAARRFSIALTSSVVPGLVHQIAVFWAAAVALVHFYYGMDESVPWGAVVAGCLLTIELCRVLLLVFVYRPVLHGLQENHVALHVRWWVLAGVCGVSAAMLIAVAADAGVRGEAAWRVAVPVAGACLQIGVCVWAGVVSPRWPQLVL